MCVNDNADVDHADADEIYRRGKKRTSKSRPQPLLLQMPHHVKSGGVFQAQRSHTINYSTTYI